MMTLFSGRHAVQVTALAVALAMGTTVSLAHAAGGIELQKLKSAKGGSTNQLIVKYNIDFVSAKGRASADLSSAKLADLSLRTGAPLHFVRATALGAHVLKLDKMMKLADVERMAAQIALDPAVEYAQPDYVKVAYATPNDPQYSSQWHYYETAGGINVPAAWDFSTGQAVVVAVLDTGYRPHADLNANILPGYDMVSDSFHGNDGSGRDSDATDPGDGMRAGECGDQDGDGVADPATDENSSWHGTHVSGTIAALGNNGLGVTGVAYNAKILPVRVLGKCGGYTSDITDGMIWAAGGTVSGVPTNTRPARVLNMSLGGIVPSACSAAEQNAINFARTKGAVVVVAAGNDNANANTYSPGNCSGVISVAATGRDGGKAWYSNTGTMVDIAAPGGSAISGATADNIFSTYNAGAMTPGSDSYNYLAGTSMATPHVSGVAALMFAANPGLSPDTVENYLKQTARKFPKTCSGCGAGIVDANAAVQAARVIWESYLEIEPNNTQAMAMNLNLGLGPLVGSMASSVDQDWFKIAVPAGKTLTVSLTPNATSDYDLFLYSASGQRLKSSENGTGQVDTVTYKNATTATVTYSIKVAFYLGNTGSAGSYSMSFKYQ